MPYKKESWNKYIATEIPKGTHAHNIMTGLRSDLEKALQGFCFREVQAVQRDMHQYAALLQGHTEFSDHEKSQSTPFLDTQYEEPREYVLHALEYNHRAA